MPRLYLLLISCVLSACNSAAIYESNRQSQQTKCRELPISQYEECMQQFKENYQHYQNKREEVIK